jgi:hypothetical protein
VNGDRSFGERDSAFVPARERLDLHRETSGKAPIFPLKPLFRIPGCSDSKGDPTLDPRPIPRSQNYIMKVIAPYNRVRAPPGFKVMLLLRLVAPVLAWPVRLLLYAIRRENKPQTLSPRYRGWSARCERLGINKAGCLEGMQCRDAGR